MTRQEKIRKLANAIKELRGSCVKQFDTVKWIRTPKPHAITRVCTWLQRLGLPVQETLDKIKSFPTREEYNKWIAAI